MDHGSTVLVQDPRLAQAMRLMQSRELPVGSSQHLHGRVEVNRCSGTLARALWTWPWRRGQGARLGLGRYRRSSGRLPGALRDRSAQPREGDGGPICHNLGHQHSEFILNQCSHLRKVLLS